MAAKRPPGKVHGTAAGADQVAAPGAPPPPPPRRATAARRAARADAVPGPDKDDLLDRRERNQKPSRKASGPGGTRLQHDDVRIDDRRITDTAPTDPE